MPNNERLQHAGGAVPTTLNGSITSGDVTCLLLSSVGWPDGSVGPFYIKIDPGLATEEKILVTSRTVNALAGLTRAADGSTANAHASGAVVTHCFSADEADAANVAVVAYLGGVTAKGDEVIGTGVGTVATLPVGADGTVRVADSTQPTGQAWRPLSGHTGTFAGTTGGASPGEGTLTVSHGAGFTPSHVSATVTSPLPLTANVPLIQSITGVGGSSFTINFVPAAGSAGVNGLAVTGTFVCFP